MGKRVMVVGGGGREHALAWKLAQSPAVDALFCAPGNPGTAQCAENIAVRVSDPPSIVAAAAERKVDLVVVGPEEPLALGLADRLTSAGIAVCGPSRAATRIESSKAWAKEIMAAAGVPTARAVVAHDLATARRALAAFDLPVVIKADGLAAGKGVVIATTGDEAERALVTFLRDRALGDAGATVLIEEYLEGREVSIFGLTDGRTVVTLPAACDYKRARDGDAGPNTGGMGAYAPVPGVDDALITAVTRAILEPAIAAMAAAGAPFQGILYAGLMLTASGPKVLEFNARLGDPETQAVLPLLETDLAGLCWAVATGTLAGVPQPAARGAAVAVVLASGGYPGPYQTGVPIAGLDAVPDGALVFHAGTARDGQGRVITAGGRVLTVVGTGADLAAARRLAYDAAAAITFQGRHLRTDVAAREVPPA